MAGDAEWVEDVRRWYLASQQSSASVVVGDDLDSTADAPALGYEAADPSLQLRHWTDVPSADSMPARPPAG